MTEFSVIISVYNLEKVEYLEESLNSIVNQEVIPSEVLILKDGILNSNLDSLIDNFCKVYPNIFRFIQIPIQSGLGKALKLGVKNAKYEYIARMDSDDINSINRFKKQIDFMVSNPNVDVCGMWIEEFINEVGDFKRIRKVPENNFDIKKFSRYRNPNNHVTVMFKKSSVLKVGNYENFPSFEDYQLWIKMIIEKSLFHNLQEVGVFVRVGNDMIARRRGFSYFKKELYFFKYLFNIGYINLFTFYANIINRFLTRNLPSKFLQVIYKKLLRN